MAEIYLTPKSEQLNDTLADLARTIAPGLGNNNIMNGEFYTNVDPSLEMWQPESQSADLNPILAHGSSAVFGVAPGQLRKPFREPFSSLLVLDKWLLEAHDQYDLRPSSGRLRSFTALVVSSSGILQAHKRVDRHSSQTPSVERMQNVTRRVTPDLLQHFARGANLLLQKQSS